MKVFSASTDISATPEKVWAILIDAAKYPEWDPAMIRLEGTIAVGQQIAPYTKLSPDRAFKATVTELVPNKKMVWQSGLPLGLFKTVRTFWIEPAGNGKVKFSTREEFSGLLLPIFGRTLPDLNPVFADFAAGLKKRAEAS